MRACTSLYQQLLDLSRGGFVVEESHERPTVEHLRRHNQSFLSRLRSARKAFITPVPFSEPRSRWIWARVMGFNTMWSAWRYTIAFVPSSISSSCRRWRGITIWPFVLNWTVSGVSVVFM